MENLTPSDRDEWREPRPVSSDPVVFRIRLCHDLARQCRPMPWVSG